MLPLITFAPILASYLYNTKDPEELTQEQKDTLTSIISLATVSVTHTTTNGDVANVVSASEVGKVGVENNGTVSGNFGIGATLGKGHAIDAGIFVTSGKAFDDFSLSNPQVDWNEFDAGITSTYSARRLG